MELRLLTDPAFGEEFDTIVDEITDQYVGNELEGEDRERVEQYFLRSAERQKKVEFANELQRAAAVERGDWRAAVPVASEPGFFERLRAFWTNQSVSLRVATTIAAIVIVAGVAFLQFPRNPSTGTYAALNLQIRTADRSAGSETKTVQLAGNVGIRIELTLPDQTPQANSYRVELIDELERSRNLAVTHQTAQSLVIEIPANEITRGSYIIRIYAVNPDGSEQRIRGSYFFAVE